MTGRAPPEWIGKTADTPVPQRVRLRVWERHGGKCHISGRKIQAGEPWEADHVIALCNWTGDGHGNRESNLAPALRDKHREKTAADVAEKARTYRKRSKHVGADAGKKSTFGTARNGRFKQKIGGQVVDRATGRPIGRER